MTTAIYTITSPLHDPKAVDEATKEFLASLDIDYRLLGTDYSSYGSHTLDLIYVRTGGAEGIFSELLPELRAKSRRPIYLLTSGKSNSLAASMEILSYLRQHDIAGEIIHGSAAYVKGRIEQLAKVAEARQLMQGKRLGIVGQPSDWLISSHADRDAVAARLGLTLEDVDMQELLDEIADSEAPAGTALEGEAPAGPIREAVPGAVAIYHALKHIAERRGLSGLTLRCFDLLTSVHNTGCIALARLNSEGITSSCEGDVPTLLSMVIAQALTGVSGFQANPSRIDPELGRILFAHCTIPFNLVERYELDTHFESGIGVGIRGYMPNGPVTILKVSGDAGRHFVAEGQLLRSEGNPGLCRTQQIIQLDNAADARYFLTNPIGNHHVIIPGHHRELIEAFFQSL